MKYLLMMSGTKAQCEEYAQWPKEDLQANFAFMRQVSKVFKDAGAFVASVGLAFPHHAKVVRAGKDGVPVTDGVFPEAKEFLCGYWIVDVEGPEQAYALAARVSMAPGPGGVPGHIPIEVRQMMSGPPEELL